MRVEGEYIAVNELYGNMVGTASVSKGILYNGNVGRRALLNGIIKYDHWITTLSAENFNMSAEGGYVSNFIKAESYGLDCENVKHDMEVSYTPDFIQANSETSSKTHSIEVKQTKTNKVLNVTCTQAAASVTWTVEASLSVGTPTASGGYVSTSVSWVRYRNGVRYDSGTVTPSSISGYSNGGYDSYISGTSVYVPNAGTNTSQPTVFTITGYSFYVDGERYDRTTTTYVYLGYNTYSTSTEYNVYCGSASTSSIANTGGTFTFTAESQSRTKYSYTSGSTTYGSWASASASVSYSNGVSYVTPTSFYGSATITATVDENFGSARNPKVTVTSSGDSDYTQVSQAAVSYEFTSNTLASIGASGGEMSLILVSRRNGKPYPVDSSDISVSGLSGTSVSLSHVGDGEYRIIVNVPANTSSSSRSFSVTATRPDGNDTYTWNVTQSGQSVTRDKVKTVCNVYFEDSTAKSAFYSVYFDATDTSKYSGGTLRNVTIELNTNRNGSASPLVRTQLSSSLYVAEGGKSTTYSGVLVNNSGNSLLYAIISYDNKVQFSTLIMSPIEEKD